ncbi:hypothetical protein [Sporosarcina sp. FSL W7-1283]|uniref:hypothetical protein n=1 Tax=Sporosarcina sp. FSL W7-1283 TaxID=2921560 RepID=UPI0030F88288
MVDELICDESRVWILGQPLICRFCANDVFLPYHTYKNVEKPGIDVFFVDYTAICLKCGCATQFGDPSGPSPDGTDYIWALEQVLLNPPEPEPPIIRTVDDKTLRAQKSCLSLALLLLVQEGIIENAVLPLVEEEQNENLLHLLEPGVYVSSEEIPAEKCLVLALSQIVKHRLLDNDKLHFIIEHESYPGIESFLRKHIE